MRCTHLRAIDWKMNKKRVYGFFSLPLKSMSSLFHTSILPIRIEIRHHRTCEAFQQYIRFTSYFSANANNQANILSLTVVRWEQRENRQIDSLHFNAVYAINGKNTDEREEREWKFSWAEFRLKDFFVLLHVHSFQCVACFEKRQVQTDISTCWFDKRLA